MAITETSNHFRCWNGNRWVEAPGGSPVFTCRFLLDVPGRKDRLGVTYSFQHPPMTPLGREIMTARIRKHADAIIDMRPAGMILSFGESILPELTASELVACRVCAKIRRIRSRDPMRGYYVFREGVYPVASRVAALGFGDSWDAFVGWSHVSARTKSAKSPIHAVAMYFYLLWLAEKDKEKARKKAAAELTTV